MDERAVQECRIHLQDTEEFRTFAMRLARRLVLKQFCGPEHPVFRIEEEMVEMASSKLLEQMYARIPVGRIRRVRAALESMIRRAASKRIMAADEEPSIKQAAIQALEAESFDFLFPEPEPKITSWVPVQIQA